VGETIVADGSTLDVNGQNLSNELVRVQGTGVDGSGAIVNSGAQQLNTLRFVTLTGNTTFGGSARWDIRANTTATLDMGGYTLTKTNVNYNPLVSVSVVNPGNIMINQGVFNFSDNTTVGGSAANTVTVRAGARMGLYNVVTPVVWSLLLEDGAMLDAEYSTVTTRNTWDGPVTVSGNTTFNSTGVLNIGGKISGAGKLTKTGTNYLTLASNNDYSGGTVVSNGLFQLGNGTLNGNIVGDIELATTNASVAFNNSDSTFSGSITGSGFVNAVQKMGNGIQYLTSNNSSYTGVTQFKGGILNVASIANYGVNSPVGARPLAMEQSGGALVGLHFQGGTLQYTGSTPQSTDRQIRIQAGATLTNTIDASGVGAGTLSFTYSGPNTNFWDSGGARNLKLTGSNTGDNLFAINISSHSAGQTALIKSGPGKWIVSNSKNGATQSDTYGNYSGYAGGTLVEGGWLAFVTNGLGAAGTIYLTGSATLEWYGANSQDISSRFKINDGVTATLNTGTNNVNFASVIQLGTAKTASLTKTGTGTLTLAATNQFVGVTSISEGSLRLGKTNALHTSAMVMLANGALDVNNQRQTLASISGTGTLKMSGGRLDVTGAVDVSTWTLNIDSTGLDKILEYTILSSGGGLTGRFNHHSAAPIPGWIPQYNYVTGTITLRYAPGTLLFLR
jgi:autotransporter-associated beta strand protein